MPVGIDDEHLATIFFLSRSSRTTLQQHPPIPTHLEGHAGIPPPKSEDVDDQ